MWVVYYVDEVCGWLFWRADLQGGVWVAEESRATLYQTRIAALAAAEDVHEREEVDSRAIALADLC